MEPPPSVRLEQCGVNGYCDRQIKECFMLALYIILGFVAVFMAINFIEFGRVD